MSNDEIRRVLAVEGVDVSYIISKFLVGSVNDDTPSGRCRVLHSLYRLVVDTPEFAKLGL